jgi:hypothetical protein
MNEQLLELHHTTCDAIVEILDEFEHALPTDCRLLFAGNITVLDYTTEEAIAEVMYAKDINLHSFLLLLDDLRMKYADDDELSDLNVTSSGIQAKPNTDDRQQNDE